MSTYNGWTNYATWRINLEIFDNAELGDFWGYHDTEDVEAYELAKILEEYVQDYLSETTEGGLALDYAFAFISDVNWTEIAQSIIDNSKE